MHLSSIKIQGFRSIAEADLAQCGTLNVLIGKNNSGKSNILSGIQLFFDFLRSSNLVATTKPPIAEATDWYQRTDDVPVLITALLQFTDAEMEKIRNAISNEASQMRNALEEVSDVTMIECQLTFYREPHSIGYLNHLSFNGSQNAPTPIIFSLQREAAEEIAKRDQEVRELRRQLSGIERASVRFDAEDWMMIRERSGLQRTRLFPNTSDEFNSTLNSMIRTSESHEEFRSPLKLCKRSKGQAVELALR